MKLECARGGPIETSLEDYFETRSMSQISLAKYSIDDYCHPESRCTDRRLIPGPGDAGDMTKQKGAFREGREI